MTNTPTLDTAKTVAQVISLAEAGCELVRITAQNVNEAHNLSLIKKELRNKGIKVPLIADIHYLPEAAEIVARIVEKVRINPGNYSERKNKARSVISDKEYSEELEKIAERLYPLLRICKEHGTVLRIGSNHGSLSQRILNHYGDTPAGMVESAMEFTRICNGFGFHDLVLSMKSSNISIVIQATRLLVAKMMSEGMDYPIHLGVTEAGDGEDGRIKSAAGIGVLLEEGIGDTIRVSLTEDPLNEIPFAKKLVEPYTQGNIRKSSPVTVSALHPYHFEKRMTMESGIIGGEQVPVVVGTDVTEKELLTSGDGISLLHDNDYDLSKFRVKFREMLDNSDLRPVIVRIKCKNKKPEKLLIGLSIEMTSLLADGLGDGFWVEADPSFSQEEINHLVFGILQATGARITRTEYIACPSCGRTNFDIQKVLQEVRSRTGQHKGLKIAVMGCIVNGPGEMADADYGYVGAGPGKVTLYKKQQIVKRNIPEGKAVEELLKVIKESREQKNSFEF